MTPDKDELRRLAREEDCPVPLPQAPVPVDPFRPTEPCAVPEEPGRDAFFAPTAPPTTPLDLPSIPPLLCGPPGMTVTCADISIDPDFTGPGVTLPPEDLDKRPFYWQDIPGITENQLAYIATLSEETRDEVVDVTFNSAGLVTAWTLSTEQITTIFQLRPSQAHFTRTLVNQMSQGSWSINYSRAISRLTCAYRNDEQTANCAAGAVAEHLGRPFTITFTVPAGEISSQISKVDANAIALAIAQGELDCLWVNDAVTRHCSQQAGLEPTQISDYQTLELGPATVTFLGGQPEEVVRVVEVTMPAGVLSSTESQVDANALATAEADLGLNCFFTSPATADCPLDVDSVPSDSPVADVFEQTPGKLVSVPAGLITTTVSQAQALIDAQAFADSLLECYWLNIRIEVLCADAFGGVVVPGPDGEPITVTISERSSTFEDLAEDLQYGASVEAGEVQSDTSRADANAQAEVIGLSRAVCIYCNGPVPPFCVPGPLWGDLAPEARPELPLIPSDYELDVENGPQWWSVDATLGVPAGRFCLENDPPGAQSIANTTGTIPFQGADIGVDCVYENDPLVYSCTEAIGIGNPSAPYLSPRSSQPVSVAGGLVFARLSTTPIGWMVGEPDHQRVKAYANELARLTALSILDCFYESPNLGIYCGAATGAALPAAANWTNLAAAASPIGTGRAGISNEYVSREATGFLTDDLLGPPGTPTPVLLPYGTGRSTVSPREALDEAIIIGQGLLDCFFHEAGTAECVPKPDMRLRHIDNRINGWDISYDGLDGLPFVCANPGYGNFANAIDKGQNARFLYSGLQLNAPLTVLTNPPGQTVPTAVEFSISYVNKADAIQQAEALARGRLDCTHTNWYRDNTYCPQGTRLAAEGRVCRDAVQADSTEMANTQAEWEAQGRTICIPDGPFNIGVRPQSNGGIQWKLRGGGVVTFPHSKLVCSNDVEPGAVIKELYWENCAGPLVGDTWRDLANGDWLFFIKAECCGSVLKYILTVVADDTSDGDIEDLEFYPTAQLEARQVAEPNTVQWYIGAARSEAEAGTGAVTPIQSSYFVRQYVDSQLTLFDGGNDQRFKPVQNPNGSLSFLEGVVVFYTGLAGKRTPHFPIWNGGALDAQPPPEGSIGTGSRKIWIRIDEAASEIFNKDAADTDFDDEGKMWILLASFSVVAGVMKDLKHIYRSDIIVGCCEGTSIDGSSTGSSLSDSSSDSSSGSSDPSSGESGSSGGGSSGDPHEGCEGSPGATLARNGSWGDPCRDKPPWEPDRFLMNFSWYVEVTDICEECTTWFARITILSPSAEITAFEGEDIGTDIRLGNEVRWIFAKPFGTSVCACTGTVQFANDPYTPCVPVRGIIEIYGTNTDPGSHPCCGSWPTPVFDLGLTPYYCGEEPCATTFVGTSVII